MQNKIEQILAELYLSDPSMKQHEPVLRKLVTELMELRPDTQFDEQFRQDLRRKLMSLAETQEHKTSLISNFMKKFQLAGAGVAFIALLAVSVWYLYGINDSSHSNLTTMLSGPKITKARDNAFGSLNNLQQAGGMGGGNGNSETLSVAPNAAPAPDNGTYATPDARVIAPEQAINFRYIYTGDELALTQEKVDVLKRIKGESNSALSDFINRISFGLVNLNSFGSAQLQNFTFAENKELGYMVNVSLSEGNISISENWAKWQTYQAVCPLSLSVDRGTSMPCEPRRIEISQVPSDEVLISAANSFLDQHGIPRDVYGEPFVNKEWRSQYERMSAAEKASFWIPDSMSVVYPLVIEGQPVFDESGNPNGLNVNVRIAPEVRVSGVWDLNTQNYESSSYAAETDVERIMKLVTQGGFRNYYYNDPNGRTVDVELGTPQVSMVKLWNYRDGTNEELLVPALIFPVTKEPENVPAYYWYRKNVVIPLVKEILDNENGNVRIMPAGSSGVTEPAAPAVMDSGR